MTTEQKLKDQCTPEFIKWMCELAEGFRCDDNTIYSGTRNIMSDFSEITDTTNMFPLLIHRAVEGWNKISKNKSLCKKLETALYCVKYIGIGVETSEYNFDDYQPQSLTQLECAMLHCLLDIFKGEI